MKIDVTRMVGMVMAVAVVAMAGCGKQSETGEPDEHPTSTMDAAAEKTGAVASEAAAATKDVAGKVVEKTGEVVEKGGAAIEKAGAVVEKTGADM